MKYEKLAEKINNSRFAGHVRQSQPKEIIEVNAEPHILREVPSGAKIAEYDILSPWASEQCDSYFGAEPEEVAGIVEELEKRKPELVHRYVRSRKPWMKPERIDVDEFYKDKDRIIRIRKGYVMDKGVRYEGYGQPKEYSLEDGMELVHIEQWRTSKKVFV